MGQKERDENMSATEKKQLRKLVLAQAKEIADLKQYLPKLSHEINLMRYEIYEMQEVRLYKLNKGDEFFHHGHWYTVHHHDGRVTHTRTKVGREKYHSVSTLVKIRCYRRGLQEQFRVYQGDGIKWEIGEDDGQEWVEEAHQRWD